MKVLIPTYTFSAAQGQVTIVDYAPIKLEQLLLITNSSKNKIIYNFADPNLGAIITNNVISLSTNTSNMEDTDALQIFVEVDVLPATETSLTRATTLLNVLTSQQTTVNLDVSAINVNTDQVEGLLTTTNTLLNSLTSLQTAVDLNVSAINLDTNNYLPYLQYVEAINTSTTSYLSYLESIYNDVNGYISYLESIYNDVNGYISYLQTINTSVATTNQSVTSINVAVNNITITQTSTPSLTSNLFITGQRRVYTIFGVSASTNNQYIHIYDSNSSTPTGKPVGVFIIPANSNFSFDINKGLKFTNGCLVINSLTLDSYSAGANDLYFTVVHTS